MRDLRTAIRLVARLLFVVALMSLAAPSWAGELIDINTASEQELTRLPGVGPARARAIVQHREESGPFQSVSALTDVHGIGPGIFSRVRDMITVDGGVEAHSPGGTVSAPETGEAATPTGARFEKPDDDGFDLDLTRDDAPHAALGPNDEAPKEDRTASSSPPDDGETARAPLSGLVNINTAGESELVTLSGIGPVRARAIISHRESHGPFRSIDQINEVAGVGPATYRTIRDRITIQVDVNRASSADLAASGVEEAAADRIVSWRAERGPIKDVEELREAADLDEAALQRLLPTLRITP